MPSLAEIDMNRIDKKENLDKIMNRRNLFSTLGKGLLAITTVAIPGISVRQKRSVNVNIHPDAVKRKSRGGK